MMIVKILTGSDCHGDNSVEARVCHGRGSRQLLAALKSSGRIYCGLLLVASLVLTAGSVACSEDAEVGLSVTCEDAATGDNAPLSYDVHALAFDAARNHLWVGTSSGALWIELDSGRLTGLDELGVVLPCAQVAAIAVDRQGDVWFGFANDMHDGHYCGVSRFSPANVTVETFDSSSSNLLDDRVYAISIAPDGAVWTGTFQGASIYRGQQWSSYFDYHDCNRAGEHCTELWSYTCKDIVFVPDGAAWLAIDQMIIGTYPKAGGIARRNTDGTTDTWNMDDGLPSDRSTSLTLRGDELWAASLDGVMRYEPEANRFEVMADYRASDITAGSQSTIWVAADQGVSMVSEGGWQSWDVSGCVLSGPVSVIASLGDQVCFGTAGGVACLDVASGKWSYPYLFRP